MPSLDASEVVVGANGRVVVAPADTATFPTTMGSLGAEWIGVGYTSEDGVTFTNSQDVEGIPAWQSFYDIRKIVTGKNTAVEFAMRQWNVSNVKLAFGGGSISVAAGVATYTPPAPGQLDERGMIVEWEDGADMYRLVFPRGLVTGEVSSNVTRTSAADLPISYEVTPAGAPVVGVLSSQPWYLLTNSPQFLLVT